MIALKRSSRYCTLTDGPVERTMTLLVIKTEVTGDEQALLKNVMTVCGLFFFFFHVKIDVMAENSVRDSHRCLQLGRTGSGKWLNGKII